MSNLPTPPIPEPLRGADSGSFAEYTIKQRFPAIARRVLDQNTLSPTAVSRLQQLIADIPHAAIRPLTDTALDSDLWHNFIQPYRRHTWLTASWFFAETYFYRRIIEAVDYFITGQDPYRSEKQQGLTENDDGVRRLAAIVAEAVSAGWQRDTFGHLLAQSLWGNQADLSMWQAGAADQPSHADEASQQDHLLVDDTAAAAALLDEDKTVVRRVDFLIDNAGFELVGDLALTDYLLSSNKVGQVRFHLKLHPTFVSDATMGDVVNTLSRLAQASNTTVANLGHRLQSHHHNGRLLLQTHAFWTSPLPMWRLPASLKQELGQAQLLISKGDANYRRLLGDAHWPFTTPFPAIVAYLPSPLVALRTLKSNVVAGLTTPQINQVQAADEKWLTSGRWGLIQLAPAP